MFSFIKKPISVCDTPKMMISTLKPQAPPGPSVFQEFMCDWTWSCGVSPAPADPRRVAVFWWDCRGRDRTAHGSFSGVGGVPQSWMLFCFISILVFSFKCLQIVYMYPQPQRPGKPFSNVFLLARVLDLGLTQSLGNFRFRKILWSLHDLYCRW